MNELHSRNILEEYKKKFNNENLESEDIKNNFEHILTQTQEKVFPILTKDIRKHVETIFSDYLSEFSGNTIIPVVTHQDFDTSNILIDDEDFKVTGIIDFEDTGLGDPAYDLIFIKQGKIFQKTLLEAYKNHNDDYLLKRIQFYYRRSGIPYLLYGIDHNLQDMIR